MFLHVFSEILDLEDDSNLHKACAHDNLEDLSALLLLMPSKIADLTYLVGNIKTVISKGHRGLLFILQAWHVKGEAEANPILHDWTNVRREEFDEYRVSSEYIGTRNGITKSMAAPPTSVAPAFIRPRDPLNEFWHGVIGEILLPSQHSKKTSNGTPGSAAQ